MQTRSKGPTNLVPLVADIRGLERQLGRQRRVQDTVDQFEQLVDMEPNQQAQQQPQGNRAQAAPARAIGEIDAPNIYGSRCGIRPPTIESNNFEIKASLLNMIQTNKFHGLPMEDPLDHLDQFDMLCGTVKMNGVSEDALKLRLFPFSLGDKAHLWEKSLPQGSITSWDQCKKAFLSKFFSTTRTARLRNEISGFAQRGTENFGEAWERFKGYTLQCPHHGFSKESLLTTLYRGVLPKYRMMLDTASNGNFLGLAEADGMLLVENLAQSNSAYGEDYDRTNRESGDSQGKEKVLQALCDKMEKMLQATQKQISFVGEFVQNPGYQVGHPELQQEGQEEVNYIGNQGYQRGFNNFSNNPNLSYRNPNVENPQDQVYPQAKPQFPNPNQGNFQQKPQYVNQGNFQQPQGFFSNQRNQVMQGQGSASNSNPLDETNAMVRQILEGQGRYAIELSTMKNEFNAKVEDLQQHIKTLDNQLAQLPSASKQSGQLPGKAIVNPKEFCNAIFSSDGNEVASTSPPRALRYSQSEEDEKAIEEDFISRLLCGSSNEDSVVERVEKVEEQPREEKVAAKRIVQEEPTEIEPPPYEPKLPFPGRFLTKAEKKVISKFRKDMSAIGVELPNMPTMKEAHQQMLLIKDILANKEKVQEILGISTTPEKPPTNPTSIPKLEDQGKFTIPCSLGDLKLDDALADSGASVNIISLGMVKSLGIKDMKVKPSSVMLGDASSKSPVGFIEDYPVKVEECTVPVDLTVLDMVENKEVPLILGRPFLNTVGAIMDFPNKKVTLQNISSTTSYALHDTTTEFCGTITTREQSIKDARGEKVEVQKAIEVETPQLEVSTAATHGKCLNDQLAEHNGSAPKERLGGATKTTLEKKQKLEAQHPPSPDPTSNTMTLHPLRFKDGYIEYKVKCKGRSRPFSSVKSKISAEVQGDPVKLQELLSQVLTINFEGRQGPNPH